MSTDYYFVLGVHLERSSKQEVRKFPVLHKQVQVYDQNGKPVYEERRVWVREYFFNNKKVPTTSRIWDIINSGEFYEKSRREHWVFDEENTLALGRAFTFLKISEIKEVSQDVLDILLEYFGIDAKLSDLEIGSYISW